MGHGPTGHAHGVISRAASYVDGIDQKANGLAAQTEQEIARMAERVVEINRLQAVVQGVADATSNKSDQVIADFKSFCDAARAEISAGAVTNQEAMSKAEEVHTAVNNLFDKCRLAYDQNKVDLNTLKETFTSEANDLRQGVYKWSATYSQEIKDMVRVWVSGPGAEQRPSASSTKHDKKELSVWKIPENVAKLDFRHWLDTVDIQLEAIHGFQFPDLVLEKIKRATTEVTKESLKAIIVGINDDNREKKRKEAIEKTGAPPGIGNADPWYEMNRAGGSDLIDPES